VTGRLLRAALGIGVTAVQVVAAVLVLGMPNPSAVLAFLGSSEPTTAGSIALVTLLLWAVLLVASGVAITSAVREASALVPPQAVRRGWSVAIVVAGVSILVAGAVHELVPPAVDLQGGGSLPEAAQELGR
jgi:DMSO reductase anchor subunit